MSAEEEWLVLLYSTSFWFVLMSVKPPPNHRPPAPIIQSVGPPDLVGQPGGHTVLFSPGGVRLAVGGEAAVAVGRLLRHHLGHQVADGATHVRGAGEGGGGDCVGAAG